MELYINIAALERANAAFETTAAVLNLLIEKVDDLGEDLSNQYARDQVSNVLYGISALLEQAHTEAETAIARAYVSPHEFKGESFKA